MKLSGVKQKISLILNDKSALWSAVAHAAILILAVAMEIIMVAKSGYSNSYYAAAVKSMLQSWSNFFFVAYDPGGFITVDKPPLALWLQTASAWLFGYQGWALLLPSLLAQVGAVELLYRMVKRSAGKWAGLLSALFLALSPISVVLGGTNETDPVLILLMLLSGWALFKAIDKNKWKYLLLSAVFIGLAFNTKMLQAYLILPAFGLTYLLAGQAKLRSKLWQLAVATVLLLVVSFSWVIAVDLVPASQRPYVGSTQDNSELSLATGYNGLQRIFGQTYGFMLGASGSSSSDSSSKTATSATTTVTSVVSETETAGTASESETKTAATVVNSTSTAAVASTDGRLAPPSGFGEGGTPPSGGMGDGGQGGSGGNGGGMGGGSNFGGQTGAFRLWGSSLGGQIGWYVALALMGLLAIAVKTKLAWPLSHKHADGLFWGLWAIAGGVVFSVAQFMHPYYTATIAPPIAALAGIGLAYMINYYREGGWKRFLLPIALLAAGGGIWAVLSNYSSYAALKIIIVSILAGCAVVLAIGAVKNFLPKKSALLGAVIGVALLAIFTAPVVWIEYSLTHTVNSTIPAAGPETSGGRGDGGQGGPGGSMGDGGRGDGQRDGQMRERPSSASGSASNNSASNGTSTAATVGQTDGQSSADSGFNPGGTPPSGGMGDGGQGGPGGNGGGSNGGLFGSSSADTTLIDYLLANKGTAKYIVATESSHTADGLIINTGEPVMAWGGFSGSDPAIDLETLQEYVKEGIVRFFYTSYNGASGGNNSEISSWVSSSCTKVTLDGASSTSLYDCGSVY